MRGHRCIATGPGLGADAGGFWVTEDLRQPEPRAPPAEVTQFCLFPVRRGLVGGWGWGGVTGKRLRQLLSHVDETFDVRLQLKVVESRDAALFPTLSDQPWFLWDVFP